MLLHTVGAIKTFHTSLVQTLLYVWDGLLSISHSQVRIFTFLGLLSSYFPSLLLDPNLGQCGGKTWNCEGKKYVVPFYISQLMWGDQNAYSAFRQKKSSGMDNKLNVVWNTVFQQGQNWGDSVFFGKVIHFLVEFSFFFLCLVVCQVLWVQWCSLGWQQRRSTLSCSMFSSWYALPTPLLPSYWQREELSPGRRPQNHDQCCKQSFHCFYLCLKYSL